MSEYQYYEFLALDRPLTAEEQRELRAISTRAEISATRFRNEYQWGNLKAEPAKLLARYFDAHVYVTNWGVHRFALRFPREIADVRQWRPYCVTPCLTLRQQEEYVLLDFEVQEEAPEFDTGADTYMSALVPIRQMIQRGDLRALYLGWLASVQSGEVRDTRREPPVPPGLKDLDGALTELCDFLFLDEDLLSVAADESPTEAGALPTGLGDFVAALAEAEKTRLLLDIVEGRVANPAAQILKRFRSSPGNKRESSARIEQTRSVGELLQRTEEVRAARQLREEEARRQAAAQAQRKAAVARTRYLDALNGQQEELWEKASSLIELRNQKAYQESVSILCDLRDLAERAGAETEFRERLTGLLSLHQQKSAFLSRVRDASLML